MEQIAEEGMDAIPEMIRLLVNEDIRFLKAALRSKSDVWLAKEESLNYILWIMAVAILK